MPHVRSNWGPLQEPIRQLNDGLQGLRDELLQDAVARNAVELAVVTFGPVVVDAPFAPVESFFPPMLTAGGDTPMGAAILEGLRLVEERKATYLSHGLPHYRPWIFLITDGAPTDGWKTAAARVHEHEERDKIMFFAIGVEGADFSVLRQISVRDPLRLKGLMFKEYFKWLSDSLKAYSSSTPGKRLLLPPSTGPKGWGEII
jgi:uncharacterized protein YegL